MLIIAAAAVISSTPGMTMPDREIVRAPAPVCQQLGPSRASQNDAPALFDADEAKAPPVRKLDREPAADTFAALLYTEGQCSKPIVIGRDLGTNPRRK